MYLATYCYLPYRRSLIFVSQLLTLLYYHTSELQIVSHAGTFGPCGATGERIFLFDLLCSNQDLFCIEINFVLGGRMVVVLKNSLL
ncbi:hypothetical protein SLEP1_g5564 [Rubroshorea leprosula]|uniref:Secreted protein n=1 Tax=Rubroshorea leprosula TaxID=152421 RepID=A0AAV5HYM9_9ROSI|nr:hypothetical protein SLEP1_g5564 [Rubroshorea leprosula]